jgi:diadenylate cyclase
VCRPAGRTGPPAAAAKDINDPIETPPCASNRVRREFPLDSARGMRYANGTVAIDTRGRGNGGPARAAVGHGMGAPLEGIGMPEKQPRGENDLYNHALRMVSPGTPIREAISLILQSRTGALLCFGQPKRLADLSEGGVRVDSASTPQLIYELAKMDGAILLNHDGTRILSANRFLKPRAAIPSTETGTRHISGERMARQAKCIVVAVSERRNSVTLYVGDRKHILDSVPTLLNRASQLLQTLERFIDALNEALDDLSVREFQDMVTIFDVCRAVQRYERVRRIASEMGPYLVELGTEGRLVSLQLQEVMITAGGAELIVKDFYKDTGKTTSTQILEKLMEVDQEELLKLGNISQILGYGPNPRTVDTYLTSRGYRILTQTQRLTPQLIDNLVTRFGSLQQILRAPKEDLVDVDGVGEVLAERIRSGLHLLQNQLALERR